MLGCLYGQAIGDALGLGTEFMSREQVVSLYPNGLSRYDQIVRDRHRCRWPIGAWTDDTDMMLCVLDGYADGGFDVTKIARNFKEWYKSGAPGIGRHTCNVLSFPDYTSDPRMAAEIVWKMSRCQSAANGAVMRTSVVGLPKEISDETIEDICRLTHADIRCVCSSVIVCRIIHALVWQERELSSSDIKKIALSYGLVLDEWIDIAHDGTLADVHLDDHDSMGYTLRTLAAALWAYFHAEDFKTGLLDIVNAGGDADTNAAVACAILGAKFGYSSLPPYYIDNLHDTVAYRRRISDFIDKLIR